MTEDLYSFPCPSCEAMLSLPRSKAGISGPCPFCRQDLTAPPAPSTGKAPPLQGTETAFVSAPAKISSRAVPGASRRSPLALQAAGMAAALAVGAAGYMAWRHFGNGGKPSDPAPVPSENAVVAPSAPASPQSADGGKEIPVPATAPVAIVGSTAAADAAAVARNGFFAPPALSRPTAAATDDAVVSVPAVAAPPVASEHEPEPSTAPVVSVVPEKAVPVPEPEVAEKPAEVVVRESVRPANPEEPAIILREPRQVLATFLKAKNWQERLAISQGAERIRYEMENYYKTQPDGPVTAEIDFMKHEFIEGTNRRVWFFKVIPPGRPAIPVALEETADGIKVDWRAFVEGYDARLAGFCRKWQEGKGTFYVAAERSHWFGPKIPDQASRVCYAVIPPTGDGVFKVWVNKDSKVWTDKFLKDGRGEWSRISNMVVTLRWEKAGDLEWLVLDEVKADSWRVDSVQ